MKHEHSDSHHVMSWWAERDVMDQAAGTERWTEAETEAWKQTGCPPPLRRQHRRLIPAEEPDWKPPDWHLSLRGLGTPLDWIRTWGWSQRVFQQTCLGPPDLVWVTPTSWANSASVHTPHNDRQAEFTSTIWTTAWSWTPLIHQDSSGPRWTRLQAGACRTTQESVNQQPPDRARSLNTSEN